MKTLHPVLTMIVFYAIVGLSLFPQSLSAAAFLVNLKASNGKYLCAETSSMVVADRNEAGDWEKWEIIKIDLGKIALRAYNGNFAGPDGKRLKYTSKQFSEVQTFSVSVREGNFIVLQSYDGKYVGVEDGKVYVQDTSITDRNVFQVISRGSTSESQILATISPASATASAEAAFGKGEYKKAMSLYVELFEKLPEGQLTAKDKYHYAASVLRSRGDTSAALSMLRSSVATDPNNSDALCELVNVLGARKMFSEILSLPGTQVDKQQGCVYRMKGLAYANLDSTDRAIENYNLALRSDSSDTFSYENLMKTFGAAGQYIDAARIGRIVSDKFPPMKNPILVGSAFRYIGEAAYQSKNFKEAIDAYTQARNLNPSSGILQRLGDTYAAMKDNLRACENYQEALRNQSSNEVAKSGYGTLNCDVVLEHEAARVALSSTNRKDWESYLSAYPNGASRDRVMKLLTAYDNRTRESNSRLIDSDLNSMANKLQRMDEQIQRWASGVESAQDDLKKIIGDDNRMYSDFLTNNVSSMTDSQKKRFQDLKDELERMYYRIKRLAN